MLITMFFLTLNSHILYKYKDFGPGPGTGTMIAIIIRKIYFSLEGFEADDLPDFSQGF